VKADIEANEEKAETTQAVGCPSETKTLHCTFGFKTQHQVKMLISGPAAIFICDECVDLCNQCVAGCFPDKSKLPSDKNFANETLAGAASANRRHVAGQG
jgi:hypothetical protein